jgi:hypothetical protein
VGLIPILFCAWVYSSQIWVSSRLPFPVSIATVSSSVNCFPVPSGSPSWLDLILFAVFTLAFPVFILASVYSSVRPDLVLVAPVFSSHVVRVQCPIHAGSSSTGSRAHRTKDRSRRFFRPQLLVTVSVRLVASSGSRFGFWVRAGFGCRSSSSIYFSSLMTSAHRSQLRFLAYEFWA